MAKKKTQPLDIFAERHKANKLWRDSICEHIMQLEHSIRENEVVMLRNEELIKIYRNLIQSNRRQKKIFIQQLKAAKIQLKQAQQGN